MIQIIKFSTPTCGPCHQYKPIFDKIQNEFPQHQFREVDCTQEPNITKNYGVKSVPTTLFLDSGGNILGREVGIVSEEQLRTKLKNI